VRAEKSGRWEAASRERRAAAVAAETVETVETVEVGVAAGWVEGAGAEVARRHAARARAAVVGVAAPEGRWAARNSGARVGGEAAPAPEEEMASAEVGAERRRIQCGPRRGR